MTGFWGGFIVAAVVLLVPYVMGGFALSRIQIAARKAARAWREIRGWAMGVGIAMAVLVVVGFVGLKFTGMLGQ